MGRQSLAVGSRVGAWNGKTAGQQPQRGDPAERAGPDKHARVRSSHDHTMNYRHPDVRAVSLQYDVTFAVRLESLLPFSIDKHYRTVKSRAVGKNPVSGLGVGGAIRPPPFA